jgi:hypothetical protein
MRSSRKGRSGADTSAVAVHVDLNDFNCPRYSLASAYTQMTLSSGS